ncbi:DNA repair and recombination protein, putative helicase [hydrothermal vent metagenome]|uniref:DNA repair and recombination protein, putative helicase n=1 Tax=hydrothermal vent metagenome TaxID=652676 RepID=A0A3B1DJT6_9ZZZZ
MKDLDFNTQFTHAYDILENSSKNVFVTGKAGTGKSTLLEYFRAHTLKNVAVLAPTGVAAINVKGQTIHSFFCFKPDVTPDTVPFIQIRKSKRNLYQKINAVVIDEISMVRADLFDCIDVFLRIHGPDKDLPFGGVQMIFFGDLFQLPPVVTRHEEDMFCKKEGKDGFYATPYFFSARAFNDLELTYVELLEVYRQKDEYFVKLLNVIRNNRMKEDHLKLLNQRWVRYVDIDDEDYYIHLTTTNAMADKINQQQLRNLDGNVMTFEGDVLGDFRERDLPTKQSLDLKEGAQVMMLNNDQAGRWVNGSIGKIVSLQGNCDSRKAIQVELVEGGVVVDVKPFTWEMFRFYYNEDAQILDSESVGEFMQYPLRLAWAVTIHKSQGKTFSKVVLDLGSGAFAHGQLYVALSRCVDFEGLVLKRPVQQRDVILDKAVVEFMNLRKN